MLNRAVLTGRLTRDVDLRYTQSGTAVGSFTLAVDRSFTNQQGEREADFINCVIWRKSAENFANFTHKGALVGIDGRIQTRNYENQQGQRVYVTEVVVDNFALLEPRVPGATQVINKMAMLLNKIMGMPIRLTMVQTIHLPVTIMVPVITRVIIQVVATVVTMVLTILATHLLILEIRLTFPTMIYHSSGKQDTLRRKYYGLSKTWRPSSSQG